MAGHKQIVPDLPSAMSRIVNATSQLQPAVCANCFLLFFVALAVTMFETTTPLFEA